jgi:hypothetical protein
MSQPNRSGVFRLAEAQKRIPGPAGEHATSALLFVAAGTEHQFEDCTTDLAVWRLFCGPPGGEIA